MRHARTDYNGRIVDTEPDDAKRIGEDEPVFLLRGTDLAARPQAQPLPHKPCVKNS